MLEKEFAELKSELDAIAGVRAKPPNWRATKIKNWDGGMVAEIERLRGPGWWAKPSNEAEELLKRLATRDEAGTVAWREAAREAKENEGAEITAGEIAERQRDKTQGRLEGAAGDEDEPQGWRKHLGNPGDDARAWLGALAKRLDANARDNKGFFGALKDHITSQKHGARIEDLNPSLVELCLRGLCSE
jgi:hypothetical protein